jgi:hypothetical protein
MNVGSLVELTRERGTPRRTASDAARLKLRTEVMQIVVPDMQSIRAPNTEEADVCPGLDANMGEKERANNGGAAKMSADIRRMA